MEKLNDILYIYGMDGYKYTVFNIKPQPAPRMTKGKRSRDATAQRYWNYRAKIKMSGIKIPESDYHIIFVIPMAKSWTKKKKAEMVLKPHQQVPDKDNLEKAVLDSVFESDSHIWDGRATKIWGERGAILIGKKELTKTK